MGLEPPRWPGGTKLVATVRSDDGKAIHVEPGSIEGAVELRAILVARFGEEAVARTWRLDEMPAAWECDGRDDCLVGA